MSRYRVMPKLDVRGVLTYAVIDTATGKIKSTRDCFKWAETDAERLNAEPVGSDKDKEGMVRPMRF